VFIGLSEAQLIAIIMIILGSVAWLLVGDKRNTVAAKQAMHA
jgi:hypothetical protein